MTESQGICSGFGATVNDDEKCIPVENKPARSLITVKISPAHFSLLEPGFDRKTTKAKLTDRYGLHLSFVSVTDLLCFRYCDAAADCNAAVRELHQHIRSQSELFLRLGLSRKWKSPDDGREGYWIQINGIYTFPHPMPYC
ncbi:MAG: hypothetical protein KDA69_09400 [Planctomycetaceae bacterium]|nr:hypothetical protein [Planctomycetaceae bacterium]MCA9044525.1 hypothetical protein [Planctomycetaceae bacterium]